MASAQPMQISDAAEVAALFYRAFRDGRRPPQEFVDYLKACFFSTPVYCAEQGSVVHRDRAGTIDSALLVIPMQVSVNGRHIVARLMSNYMTDPRQRTRGGADLVLTIRARYQELCFSDSANPVSADHWKAVGGHLLPIQSLDFQRLFRPAEWFAIRAGQRLPKWLRVPARVLARPIDSLLRRLMPGLAAKGAVGMSITPENFVSVAPGLLDRFAVHPVWSAEELAWLLEMAGLNTVNGPLQLREVRDEKGHLSGCAVFYAQRGGVARVLNILARPEQEAALVQDLMAHLDTMGCVAVEGMAQPFLMEALRRQKGVSFVPRGGYCISTKHAEIVDAAQRGDFYLGGLAGEDWSRLVTDFHD